jgi:peptidylprolyl isomerase
MLFGRIFRKHEKNPHPMPNWLKWLIAFVVLYLAIQGSQMNADKKNYNPTQKALDEASESLRSQKVIDISEYKRRLFPDYNAVLKMSDTAIGDGSLAICGQEAEVAYKSFQDDNTIVEEIGTKAKPFRFKIGHKMAMPALEHGIIGMHVGGKRTLFSPPSMAYGSEEFKHPKATINGNFRFEMELISVSPALPDPDSIPYRIANIQRFSGDALICGQQARFNIIIWDLDGKKLYTSPPLVQEKAEPEPKTPPATGNTPENSASNNAAPVPKITGGVSFTPGKSEVFIGLEQGVLGMTKGSVRTLVVPPVFLKTMNGNPTAIAFPLPENESVLVDVEYLP